ncbi:hypothetical protein POM88_038955 [Heracleum sosnowskyi]|uniref:Protein kinase domain-containing protein n=1 Tax=Heracleum sosnowskyi TaxID=360622 RepID=A0AAD8M8B7_9APIA|nr:hypothetical protein POM88_038955 [Heracleum sosnowskyi]
MHYTQTCSKIINRAVQLYTPSILPSQQSPNLMMIFLTRSFARDKGRNNITVDDLVHEITLKGRGPLFNDIVNVPFQSEAFIAGIVAFFLDNTLHKKDSSIRKDRATTAETASLRASFRQEVAVWHQLDHPNVTRFIGASMGTSDLKIPHNASSPSEVLANLPARACCVVIEYVPGGTLKSLLYKDRKKKLAFRVVVQLALNLALDLKLACRSLMV